MPDKESSQPTQATQRQKGDEQGQPSQMKQTNDESSQQLPSPPARRDWFTHSLWRENPFTLMQRLSSEMDRMFGAFGKGRGLPNVRFGRGGEIGWSPELEVYERDNQLVVCVDLPGMKKDDIHVEITEDALIIQGERQHEFASTHEGYQRSERSYGSFYRTVPLPDGIDPEQMRASFQDGVLKVTVPLPQQQQKRQSRRIEIQDSQSRENAQSSNKPGSSKPSDQSMNS
jgi:HSP20 family protein